MQRKRARSVLAICALQKIQPVYSTPDKKLDALLPSLLRTRRTASQSESGAVRVISSRATLRV